MKAAVIYYSMHGNTKLVAEKAAKLLEADIIRIEPVKEYPSKGFSQFVYGGRAALKRETPELKPYEFDASKYECIIIGSPVWAARIAPPINSFIEENKSAIAKKAPDRIGLYLCQSGSGAAKAAEQFKKALGHDEIGAQTVFTDPAQHPEKEEENDKKVEEFCSIFKQEE